MRTFTAFAEKDPLARRLVEDLPRLKGNTLGYREKMRLLGTHLADGIIHELGYQKINDICVICTVEDADFLARGVIEELEKSELGSKIHMICLWNERIKKDGVSISPVLKTYEEDFERDGSVFIIVKSIISGACVVRTNLTRAISTANPQRVFVASPVMLKGAETRLSCEFPDEVAKKFEFVHFATDTDKSPDGEEVIPGIGGSVYELLGLGDSSSKNRYMPEIVRERRRKAFPGIS
jgi:hypothetical protein